MQAHICLSMQAHVLMCVCICVCVCAFASPHSLLFCSLSSCVVHMDELWNLPAHTYTQSCTQFRTYESMRLFVYFMHTRTHTCKCLTKSQYAASQCANTYTTTITTKSTMVATTTARYHKQYKHCK